MYQAFGSFVRQRQREHCSNFLWDSVMTLALMVPHSLILALSPAVEMGREVVLFECLDIII